MRLPWGYAAAVVVLTATAVTACEPPAPTPPPSTAVTFTVARGSARKIQTPDLTPDLYVIPDPVNGVVCYAAKEAGLFCFREADLQKPGPGPVETPR